jgi:YdjC-like protein
MPQPFIKSSAGLIAPREAATECSLGSLIINADDWGREVHTTQMINDCVRRGTVSSVSAMVFMEDSVRAAEIARESRIDAGLHLNFTAPFSSAGCPSRLLDHQYKLIRFLQRHSFACAIYHPRLVRSFKYVLESQLDEYRRIYGSDPARIDGHHHMHLCSNVLLGGLLPSGKSVRRYFSYESGQKIHNRIYRCFTDVLLARRYRLTDFFFSLTPIQPPDRVQRIFSLARRFVVEVETHPVNMDEYRFLMGDEIFRWVDPCSLTPGFAVRTE